jgi:heme-degrading monooxygenase HmoA
MPALPWTSFVEIEPDRQYLVMASRLPLRSYWKVPAFLRLTLAVRRQLANADGLVGYPLLAEPLAKRFWTLSAWRSGDHLAAFARALPHADVVRRLRPHMVPTTFVTWNVAGSALPVRWDEAKARLADAAVATARLAEPRGGQASHT